jgi:uncharacterized membrane-anchored protein
MKPGTGLFAAALGVALLQIGFLAWMIQARADILRNGREVRLEVEPVDPRDLLRGDYVRLGYDMSILPKTLFSTLPEHALAEGTPILVDLEADDEGLHQPVAVHLSDNAPLPDPTVVRVRGTLASSSPLSSDMLRLRYGIERFYLPEGEGRAIEADMRMRSFYVIAAVSAAGQAQIKAFQDGDTTLYQEPLY